MFKLKKSTYGLVQASYERWALFTYVLKEMDYRAVDGSECFYVYRTSINGAHAVSLLCFHVDDWAHAFSHNELNDRIINKFNEIWELSNVGPLTWYLGMKVEYEKGVRARISQRSYLEGILKRFNFKDCHTKATPMSSTVKISIDDCPQVVNNILGSLMYASYTTRGDITNACAQLARVMSNPGPTHLIAGKRILRYIAGTLD